LKTAITVVEMREVLRNVEGQYNGMRVWGKDVLDSQAKGAERYAKTTSQGIRFHDGTNVGGENVRIASAVAFIKTCFDIMHHQSSFLLSAKALLAARLTLNTVPKVFPVEES
jgi:hypothetical protein